MILRIFDPEHANVVAVRVGVLHLISQQLVIFHQQLERVHLAAEFDLQLWSGLIPYPGEIGSYNSGKFG
jgi:hypothetical protein